MKLRAIGVIAFSVGVFVAACSRSRNKSIEPIPTVRVDLSQHGLPNDFFQADADTKCAHQIIGYRFVAWPNNETVAVGFNTSSNCRLSPDQKVRDTARILVFNTQGALKASRDLPYDSDGGQVLVAPGEAGAGPGGTILFRIEEPGESKSAILLLDANFKDAARLDRFLEQTTFVDHALVFQEGVVWSGSRTYDTFGGFPLVQTRKKEELWPVGTMDRKFGEHCVAYMLCQQELRPNECVSDNVVYGERKKALQNGSRA